VIILCLQGKVYVHNPDYMNDTFGWISFFSDKLLFFPPGGDLVHFINPDTLAPEESMELEGKQKCFVGSILS